MVDFLQIGCNAVSWGPAVVPGSLIDQPTGQKPNYVKRFVSGGCDNLVKLWKYDDIFKSCEIRLWSPLLAALAHCHRLSLPLPQRGRWTVEGGSEAGGSQRLGERCWLGSFYRPSYQHHRQLLPGENVSIHPSIHPSQLRSLRLTAALLQDGRVFIWTCEDPAGNTWTAKLLHKFNDVVWHVSWSITGNILAVSGGDNKVRGLLPGDGAAGAR